MVKLLQLLYFALAQVIADVHGQLLSAEFTQCLQSAPQAPDEQKLNINRVYAQLDTGRESSGSDGDNTDHQALLRLVALGETGVQSEGFSNVTNYLATLVVETSILSFVPHSNQTSLCSSIITAAELIDGNSNITASQYPDPGGCPYGPGPILIGYKVPLGDIGLQDYYPLSTLSTRLRVLDTSVPPLQLACIDVHTTPYYEDSTAATERDKSVAIYKAILWIPIATFLAYLAINIIARIYAATTLTQEEREAALASSLTVKLTDPTKRERLREILLETAVGRSIIRSRSLTRFVTPGVGDVLGLFQWIAMVGMCSVVWQGYAYTILTKMAWSMLVFNTTIVSPMSEHTDPAFSAAWYPPRGFRYNSDSLFETPSSPFYFSAQQSHSNLLNIPATGAYNMTNATSAAIYPSESEVQGIASFSAMIGLRPQDLFANCLTFFAMLLAGALLVSLTPAALVYTLRLAGRPMHSKAAAGTSRDGMVSEDSEANPTHNSSTYELSRTRLQSSTGRSEIDSARGSGSGSFSKEQRASGAAYESDGVSNHKYMQAPTTPGLDSHVEEYVGPTERPSFRPPPHRTGIVRWWAGDKGDRTRAEEAEVDTDAESNRGSSLAVSSYYSTRAWLAFCQGLVIRLVCFFHLPITIFSVYQLAHASSTSSVISTVFAAIVFCIFSLAIPIFLVFKIRRTLTRYLQDDTNTLLAIGPVYNTYAQDSYTFAAVRFTANLIEGCVVGGGQNRGTVQVAVILAVEIVETLVTSIWLPWGDGASQGPLQFILSVSRIIIAVLLIVIAPAVKLSFTARGWIGYVIILMAALMVLMLLAILLVKLVELIFRLVAKVDFDESRSTRHTGIIGALRKKEIIGVGRKRRKHKGSYTNRKSMAPTTSAASVRASGGFGTTSRQSRPSFGEPVAYETGYLDPSNRMIRPSFGRDSEEDNEHIMSAFRSRPQSTAYASTYYDPGYVPPGSYAAPSNQLPNAGGFSVVRGGRATDDSPYTMTQPLPRGAAAPPSPGLQRPHIATFGPDGLPQDTSSRPAHQRARASSQSAIVEELPPSPNSPAWTRRISAIDTSGQLGLSGAHRRLSAPAPISPTTFPSGAPISTSSSRPALPREPSSNTQPGWRRESSTGSGFFSSLFRGPTKSEENEDVWSDSDESDDGQHRTNAVKRRWLFGKGKNKPISAEAAVREEAEQYEAEPEWEEALGDAEDDIHDENAQPPTKGFQVIRKPMPGSRPSAE